MSPVQRSTDPARNLLSIWLGPTNGWRWPFDATYTEWGIGFLAFWVYALLVWRVAPVAVLVALAGLRFGRWAAERITLDRLARITFSRPAAARRRGRYLFAALVALMAFLLVPSPLAWLLPSPWWLAPPVALTAAVLTTRRIRPFVDGNRPVPYWLATLTDIVTHRPRAQRAPFAVEIVPLLTPVAEDGVDQRLIEWTMAALAVDPKEIIVLQYRERRPVVEAMLFDSTARDERCGEHVVAWLRDRGVSVTVTGVTYARDETRGVDVLTRAFVLANGAPLLDDTIVVFDRTLGTVECVSRRDFAARYEQMLTVAQQAQAIAQGGGR
jgi:hypothetical protein